ncbi:MAG: septum formation initiator [Sporolactobacillus sp.]|jgi:hypothetical protein|nr:septum formation initiator [Sporolactobacillus sp.]
MSLNDDANKKTNRKNQGLYVAIGICIGSGIGTVFNHLTLGIIIGAVWGIALSHFKKS